MKTEKLPDSTVKYLSERLRDEQNANRFYRYASNCLRNKGYLIAAKYYEKEAADEIEHAMGLEVYATDWNVELEFLPLPGVGEIDDIIDIINSSYGIELKLFGSYKENVSQALNDSDFSTFNFLQKYIDIQTKSVSEYATILNKLELFDKEDKNWLFNNEEKLFEF